MASSPSPASSPLSSVASRSPSPPVDYPSPPSSNVSDKGSVSPVRSATESAAERDGPPPAKKRKIAGPKELKTEYLDLRALNDSDDEAHHKVQDAKLKKLMETLRSKRKIVVIAGAGISVSAGIPDFRSRTGLFKSLRNQHKLKSSGKQLFDASVYKDDSATTSFHKMVREMSHLTKSAQPTPFHHMLATLAEEGRLMRLYSQNVDDLDTALPPLATKIPLNAKGPWPKTIQLHGSLAKMVCSKCHFLSDFDGALFEGPDPPPCPECEDSDMARTAAGLRSHGIGRMRPRMVLYNEHNPDQDAIGNASHADIKSRPDAVIVVGTSLQIPGIRRLVRELCAVTRDRRGGFTAWINLESPPVGVDLKDCWDMVVRGECDEIARYVGLPNWDDKDCGEYRVVEKQEAKDSKKAAGLVAVALPSKLLLENIKTEGILTPIDTSRSQSPQPAAKPMKQSVLSFSDANSAKASEITKPKAKKPTNRKPLPTDKPKNKITNSFTNTKSIASSSGKPVSTGKSDIFPDLFKENSKPAELPQTPKRFASPSGFSSDSDLTPPPAVLPDHFPSSQPQVIICDYQRSPTVSPPGKPSGMENLIT